MRVKAITFDFWNTLFIHPEGERKKLQELRKRFIIEATNIERERISTVFQEVSLVFDKILRQAHQSFTTEDFVSEILKRLRVPLPRGKLARVVKSIEEALLQFPPLPVEHLHSTIQNLSKNYKLGIVSNTGLSPGRVLREVIKKEGLLKYFKSFSFSNETGVVKPNPEAFQKVLRELGVKPEDAVHIGDLERTDIEGAKKIGMKTILFNKDKGETRADFIIDSFDKLPEILKRMNEAIV